MFFALRRISGDVVARSVTTATMHSAAASSSALGLVFAATLAMEAMVLSAASSTPLLVASVQMLFLAVAEPMSPAPTPPCYWCDLCKEFALMPHTLEYNYSLPSPTPVTPTAPVATPLHPCYLATQAAPALDAVKVGEEEVVTGPGIGYLINPGGTRAARTDIPPYYVMGFAGPSAPPLAAAPATPSATRAEAAARMKAQALPDPPPAETLPTPTLRRLLVRKTAAMDQRPGLRRTTQVPGTQRILASRAQRS